MVSWILSMYCLVLIMTSFLELFFECYTSIEWFIGITFAVVIILAELTLNGESFHGVKWTAWSYVDGMIDGCEGKPRLSWLYASLAY